MLNLKESLCLLAILGAYGIAGRLDSDVDAPREDARAALMAHCAFDDMHGPQRPLRVQLARPSGELQRELPCPRDGQ